MKLKIKFWLLSYLIIGLMACGKKNEDIEPVYEWKEFSVNMDPQSLTITSLQDQLYVDFKMGKLKFISDTYSEDICTLEKPLSVEQLASIKSLVKETKYKKRVLMPDASRALSIAPYINVGLKNENQELNLQNPIIVNPCDLIVPIYEMAQDLSWGECSKKTHKLVGDTLGSILDCEELKNDGEENEEDENKIAWSKEFAAEYQATCESKGNARDMCECIVENLMKSYPVEGDFIGLSSTDKEILENTFLAVCGG